MTCKLQPQEKSMRSTIRQMRNIMNQMLDRRVYPTHYNIKWGMDSYQVRPMDQMERFYTGMNTISFTYHHPSLRKAKKK